MATDVLAVRQWCWVERPLVVVCRLVKMVLECQSVRSSSHDLLVDQRVP